MLRRLTRQSFARPPLTLLVLAALFAASVAGAQNTPTATPTQTFTFTATTFLTFTPSPTRTFTSSATPTRTLTFTATAIPSATRTATRTATWTNTPDPRPAIRISDVLGIEGNIGTRLFNFIITLSKASTSTVTVTATTANGTATNGSDYIGGSTVLSFPPGAMSVTLPVRVIGDGVGEPFAETFFVNLSNASNAVIADAQGRATITDDDVGISELTPHDSAVEPGVPLALTLHWVHPEAWRQLNTVDLRLRDAGGVIVWVRFDEMSNTFSLVDADTGAAGPGYEPHSDVQLATPAATVFLSDSGWDSPEEHQVDITWSFIFDAAAAGGVYAVETAATDDRGNVQDFEVIGSVTVGGVCEGDCGGNGEVTVEELITAVNIALDVASVASCPPVDANHNGTVGVNELIRAVNRALGGCAAAQRDAPLVSHLRSPFPRA